ncbi:MAG TPA: MerR family transcriptional regulator [Candidatus Nanopelagicales bacterium]|nr:MerR family transcriptional regulator [Candidatus Nanopelagicales bacterium]
MTGNIIRFCWPDELFWGRIMPPEDLMRVARQRRTGANGSEGGGARGSEGGGEGGYTLEELIRQAGVTVRALRYYRERRVLPQPELRGRHTRYDEEYLLRLRVILHLRRTERLGLEAIRNRLAGLGAAGLRALLPPEERGAEDVAPAAAPAPVDTLAGAAGAQSVVEGEAPQPVSADGTAKAPRAAERWDRIVLVAGLELHVRADAGALIQRLAQEIQAQYGTTM